MGKEVYRRCRDCGTININTDYCGQCGSHVNIDLKRQLARQRLEAKKEEERKLQGPDPIARFFEKALNHPNFLVAALARVLYSIWVVVMLVGAFIAFLFGYVAA